MRFPSATPTRPGPVADWIAAAKAALVPGCSSSGHHYQRDEVMVWADARGDSFGLSRLAADRHDAELHRLLRRPLHGRVGRHPHRPTHQQVLLPDLNAGCSMADMADLESVEEAWEALDEVTDVERIVPVTYMNSSADLKAFVGRHGGAVCTSSNARAVLTWALGPGDRGRAPGRQGPLLPRPAPRAQHRFPARLRRQRHGRVEPPARPGGAGRGRREGGHGSSCGRVTARSTSGSGPSTWPPSGPSTPRAWSSSTPSAPTTWSSWPTRWAPPTPSSGPWPTPRPGRCIGVGTEIHLVKRLDDENPDKTVVSPRSPGLPVLDHVPDRRPPPGLGARGPGRGRGPSIGSRSTPRRRPPPGWPWSGCWPSSDRRAPHGSQAVVADGCRPSGPPPTAEGPARRRPPPSPAGRREAGR